MKKQFTRIALCLGMLSWPSFGMEEFPPKAVDVIAAIQTLCELEKTHPYYRYGPLSFPKHVQKSDTFDKAWPTFVKKYYDPKTTGIYCLMNSSNVNQWLFLTTNFKGEFNPIVFSGLTKDEVASQKIITPGMSAYIAKETQAPDLDLLGAWFHESPLKTLPPAERYEMYK